MQQSISRKQLEQAAANANSIYGVLRLLGKSVDSGGAHALIKKLIHEFEIDTKHFTGQAWNKGNASPLKLSSSEFFERHRANKVSSTRLRQALLDSGRKHECVQCGLGPIWNSQALTIQVDHINGNDIDNREENLRFLCPNCHSQTNTFCSKNRQMKLRKIVSDNEIIAAACKVANRRQALKAVGLSAVGQSYKRIDKLIKEGKINFNVAE